MAEQPAPGPLWTGQPRPEDDAQVRLWQVVAELVALLERGWTRNLTTCAIDEYEPRVVRFRLQHFDELISAANGTSAAGAEAIGSAGETDSRRTLIAIKADLEQATDFGLASILNWRQAERIYKRQWRHDTYRWRLATFRATWREEFTPEPSPALAESICIERISRMLGWRPHICDLA